MLQCYRVEFVWNGRNYQELVTTQSFAAARSAVEARYPGARIYNVSLVR
jgi:hypothetical protein